MLRFVKRLTLILIVLAIGVVAFIWWVGRTPPTWYAPPDPADETVALTADRVEYGVIEQAQKARPSDDPWALRIEETQLNAWLSARLRAWVGHEHDVEWPERLGTPQVRIEAGQVSLALPVDGAKRSRVIVAELAPRIQGGSLWLHLAGLRMGRLAVPGDPVESLLGMASNLAGDDAGQAARVIDLLTAREPIEPVMELADGRVVRLVDLRCLPGAVEVTCRTIAARPQGRGEIDSNPRE